MRFPSRHSQTAVTNVNNDVQIGKDKWIADGGTFIPMTHVFSLPWNRYYSKCESGANALKILVN